MVPPFFFAMLFSFPSQLVLSQLIMGGDHYGRNVRLIEKIRQEGLTLTDLPFGEGPERKVAQMIGTNGERSVTQV